MKPQSLKKALKLIIHNQALGSEKCYFYNEIYQFIIPKL